MIGCGTYAIKKAIKGKTGNVSGCRRFEQLLAQIDELLFISPNVGSGGTGPWVEGGVGRGGAGERGGFGPLT